MAGLKTGHYNLRWSFWLGGFAVEDDVGEFLGCVGSSAPLQRRFSRKAWDGTKTSDGAEEEVPGDIDGRVD
jgi:hypothetical protein